MRCSRPRTPPGRPHSHCSARSRRARQCSASCSAGICAGSVRTQASRPSEPPLSIRGSHSKISRMEHGRVGFKERDIADLLDPVRGRPRETSARRCSSSPGRSNRPAGGRRTQTSSRTGSSRTSGSRPPPRSSGSTSCSSSPACCRPRPTPAPSSGSAPRSRKTRSSVAPRPGSPARRSCAGSPRRRSGRSWTRARCTGSSAAPRS